MKVPNTFAEAAKASAEQVPREVISNLLIRLMPRKDTEPKPLHQVASFPSPASRAQRPEPKRRARTAKRRITANRRYRVLHEYGYTNHRKRTWRRAMVECILNNDNETGALIELVARYPQYADKGIDLTWVAEHAGYVEII